MDFGQWLFGEKPTDGQADLGWGDMLGNAATLGLWGGAKAYYQTGDAGQALTYGNPFGNVAILGSMATGRYGADDAAAQEEAARLAAEEEAASIAAAQAALDPYNQAGVQATEQQQALMGLLGPEAQRAAYAMIENSPAFRAQMQMGEEAILQNAAATGGLRGGNTQAALAQFRPQLLDQLIQQQLGGLSGLSGQGLGAAGQFAGLQAGSRSNLAGIRSGGVLGQQQSYRDARQQVTDLGMQGLGIAADVGGKLATGGML